MVLEIYLGCDIMVLEIYLRCDIMEGGIGGVRVFLLFTPPLFCVVLECESFLANAQGK